MTEQIFDTATTIATTSAQDTAGCECGTPTPTNFQQYMEVMSKFTPNWRYPSDWYKISFEVRFIRAKSRCEQCNKPYGIEVDCATGGYWKLPDSTQWHNNQGQHVNSDEVLYLSHWQTKVKLQCAHIGAPLPDGRPGSKHNKKDVRPENLKSLCTSCHLELDKAEHIGQNRNMLNAAKFKPQSYSLPTEKDKKGAPYTSDKTRTNEPGKGNWQNN